MLRYFLQAGEASAREGDGCVWELAAGMLRRNSVQRALFSERNADGPQLLETCRDGPYVHHFGVPEGVRGYQGADYGHLEEESKDYY